jgi:alkylation response protein AidB-like acyl-CoA dehydrogenase
MLSLSDEQRMIVETLADVADSEFADEAFEWNGEIPWPNVETLADHGFLGLNFDEEYGGGGYSEFEAMLMVDVIGRVCPDTATFVLNQHFIGPRAIDMFGSDRAKEEYLPPVINGDASIVIAMSEPAAGSDIHAMTTTVEPDDGDLYLNGEKIWVSDVPDARAAVVWTKFPEGLGSVVINFDDPGVEIAQHFTNMAGAPQSQFYLEDVRIPEWRVLTRGGEGFHQQLKSLNWERLGLAQLSNAVAGCALERAVEYAADREQFGQPIVEFQGLRWKIAEMVKQLEASRALTYRAGERAVAEDRVPDPLDATVAKLFATETAQQVVDEALQIHGANGYQQGHPLEYLYRAVRGYRIAGGTDEIMRNTIMDLIEKEGVPGVL